MSDCISRDAVRSDEICKGISCGSCPFRSETGIGCRLDSFIQSIPPADVVPVVRCRDCSYCYLVDYYYLCRRNIYDRLVTPDDYCSKGERRDDIKSGGVE